MPPGERVRLRSTSYQASGMPASGTMSCSRAAVIEEWTRASPSHISSTLEDRVGFTAPMVDGARRGRTPLCRSTSGLRELCCLDHDLGFDLEPDGVAGHGDGARKAVPVEAEIHPVELPLSADAEPLLSSAHRVRYAALERRVQHDRLGRVLDGEVALDLEGLAVDRLDAVELEGDLGVLFGLEEIGRAEVVVTHLRPGVDAGDVDPHLAFDLGDVVLGPLEVALERVELPTHG